MIISLTLKLVVIKSIVSCAKRYQDPYIHRMYQWPMVSNKTIQLVVYWPTQVVDAEFS